MAISSVSHTICGTGSQSGSGNTWANIGNITADDSSVARVTPNPTAKVAEATNFGFSALPAGATMVGIEAIVKCRYLGGGVCNDAFAGLLSSGSPVGDDVASAVAWPGSFGNRTYGGSTDTMGATITDPTTLGFAIQPTVTAASATDIDYISLAYWYQTAEPDEIHEFGNDGQAVSMRGFSWLAGSGTLEYQLDGKTAALFAGRFVRAVTKPGVTGAPTADYNIRLINDVGRDILDGALEDRSATLTETEIVQIAATAGTSLRPFGMGRLTLQITDAGAGGNGVVAFYFDRTPQALA